MKLKLFPTLALSLLSAVALLPAAKTAAQDAKPETKARPDAARPNAPNVDAKAAAIVARALEAMGGSAYLDVRSVVSHGYFTQFHDGLPGTPITFRDYTVFPDRERTEYKGSTVKSVEVYTGDTGWIFDGMKASKPINDASAEQVANFHLAMRTGVDNILRGWWRTQGASLTYVGRREASVGRRNETVRLTYPDGFEVEFEFDEREFLPAKMKYKKQNAEGETVEEEDRYAQFQTFGAARVPLIVDHYRAGVQSSRVNYDDVQLNASIPDSLFNKPADAKSVKF